MEAADDIKFTRVDNGNDYTTGVTFFGGTSTGDPNFTDGYKGVSLPFLLTTLLNVGYNNGLGVTVTTFSRNYPLLVPIPSDHFLTKFLTSVVP